MIQQRDLIGRHIQHLRKVRKITGAQLASSLGISQSLISKIENGRIKPSPEFISSLCEELKLSRKERTYLQDLTTAFLVSFARWSQDQVTLADLQQAVAQQENQAGHVRIYSSGFISGLLQTEEYASAIFEIACPQLDAAEKSAAVKERMKRQRVLMAKKKEVTIILNETTLAHWFCGIDAMGGQLDKILSVIENHPAAVGILPVCKPVGILPLEGYVIYDQKRVDIESYTTNINFWERQEIDMYEKHFTAAHSEALFGKDACEVILTYREKLLR